MYIKNILIEGFGKFNDQSFSFNKNVNLIFGKNESGKTTIVNFIFAILFGFKDENGNLVEEYYKFKPWNHKFYGGELTFRFNGDDEDYIIKRDFLTGDIFLYKGQKDITSLINYEPNGEISFIKDKLGFSRSGALNLFKHTDTQVGSGLNDYIIKLENFMEKENDTIMVKNALTSIADSIKNIGEISDSSTPLGNLSTKSKELENRLSSLKEKYNQIWNIQEKCNNLNLEINSLIEKKHTIIDQIKSYEVKDVLNKLKRIKNFRNEYNQLKSEILQIEKYKDVDSSEIISLERLEATLQELQKNLEKVRDKYLQSTQRLKDLEKRIEIYEQKFGIRDFSDIDKLYLKLKNINLSYGIIKERMRMLNDLESDLNKLRSQSQKLLKEFNNINEKFLVLGDLEDFNSQVDSYLAAKKAFDESSIEKSYSVDARLMLTDKNIGKFKFAFFIGALTIFIGFLLGFFINPWLYLIGAAGLFAMVIYLFEIARSKSSIALLSKKMEELKKDEDVRYSKLKQLNDNILKTLQIAGIKNIEEYKALYKNYMSIKNKDNSKVVDEKLKEIQKLKEDIDSSMLELSKDLAALKMPGEGSIEKDISTLNEEIENYKNLSFEKGKLIEDSNRFKIEMEDIKDKLRNISDDISSKLKDLGFDDIESYRMALKKKDRYFKLFTDLKQVEIDLEKFDAGKQEEMEHYIKENEKLINIEPKATEKQLKEHLKTLEEQIEISKSKLNNMLSRLEDDQRSIDNIGIVRSELNYLNFKIASLIDKKNNLVKLNSIMQDFYDKVRKNFIPRLNKETSAIFNSIVENNSYDLEVNDKLEVEVIYRGENITSNISTGTYHQLALSLKLALASIMSTSEESLPVLLDDAFSEYDNERIKPTVKFLKSVSKNLQIIISSCRLGVLDSAKEFKFKIINPR